MSRHFFCCCKKTYNQIQSRLVNKKTYSNLKEKKLAACWILQRSGDENWKKTTCWFWNSVWFVNAAKQIQNTSFSPEKRFDKVRMLQCTRALLFLECTKDELERRSTREERDKKYLNFRTFVAWFVLFWYLLYVRSNPLTSTLASNFDSFFLHITS